MKINFSTIILILLLTGRFEMSGQEVRLRCTEVLGNGDVILYWTPVDDPAGFLNYTIYSSSSFSGPYTEIASVVEWQEVTYLHPGAGANLTTIYYYLITNTSSGPPQPSEIISTKPLSPPMVDSVSIDVNGKVIIGWKPSPEPNIQGYQIYRITTTNPPINDSIDYIDGRFNTSYIHQSADPCSGPLSYTILSVDLCGNESPFPYEPDPPFPDIPYTTIYLTDIDYDPCQMTNYLSWNEYENFEPPLAYTRIYISRDNGPFEVLYTALPGQVSFTHENLQPHSNYNYFVRAFSQDNQKSSTSCRKQVTTYNSPIPAFMYTRYVTVEDNQQVNILFHTDISAHAQYYRIMRSTSPGGPFEEIGTIEDEGEENVFYTDASANVNQSSYYYQIEVVDSCGIERIIADVSRTIFLQVEALDDMKNVLTWNAYELWDGSVAGYRVYRRLNDNNTLELIQDVGASTLTYTDDASALTLVANRITYLLEAYEGNSNAWGYKESSFSNEALAEQKSKIYMPNAILPRSNTNNVLRPVSVFVGDQGYELRIYNRWGQQIFQTSDPGEGWNGTYKGMFVEAGMYVYMISYRNALNQPEIQKGNVVVIY